MFKVGLLFSSSFWIDLQYGLSYCPNKAILPRICLPFTYIGPIDCSALISKPLQCFKSGKMTMSSCLKHLQCFSLGSPRHTENLGNHSTPSSRVSLLSFATIYCVRKLSSGLLVSSAEKEEKTKQTNKKQTTSTLQKEVPKFLLSSYLTWWPERAWNWCITLSLWSSYIFIYIYICIYLKVNSLCIMINDLLTSGHK